MYRHCHTITLQQLPYVHALSHKHITTIAMCIHTVTQTNTHHNNCHKYRHCHTNKHTSQQMNNCHMYYVQALSHKHTSQQLPYVQALSYTSQLLPYVQALYTTIAICTGIETHTSQLLPYVQALSHTHHSNCCMYRLCQK